MICCRRAPSTITSPAGETTERCGGAIRQLEAPSEQIDPSAASIDNQSVKTSERSSSCGYDGGKQITGRKRSIAVDTLGLLLAVVVTIASVDDAVAAREHDRNRPIRRRSRGKETSSHPDEKRRRQFAVLRRSTERDPPTTATSDLRCVGKALCLARRFSFSENFSKPTVKPDGPIFYSGAVGWKSWR